MTKEVLDTRKKILETASQLFAQFGFAGSSVRDIAKASDVNLASINYHFKNKEGLYWEAFFYAHQWFEKGIEETAQTATNLDELINGIYEYISQDQVFVRNTIRLLLEESVSPPDNPELLSKLTSGPPGEETIKHFIQKEAGSNLSEEQVHWATKTLLGSLMHWGMLCSTSKIKLMREKDPRLSHESIKSGFSHLCQSTIQYIKNNKF